MPDDRERTHYATRLEAELATVRAELVLRPLKRAAHLQAARYVARMRGELDAQELFLPARSKEWWMTKAELEGNSPVSAGVPRRAKLEEMVPAELAILEACYAVEKMPPDERLTDAVVLLGKARDAVADYVDGVPKPTPAREHSAPAAGGSGEPALYVDCYGLPIKVGDKLCHTNPQGPPSEFPVEGISADGLFCAPALWLTQEAINAQGWWLAHPQPRPPGAPSPVACVVCKGDRYIVPGVRCVACRGTGHTPDAPPAAVVHAYFSQNYAGTACGANGPGVEAAAEVTCERCKPWAEKQEQLRAARTPVAPSCRICEYHGVPESGCPHTGRTAAPEPETGEDRKHVDKYGVTHTDRCECCDCARWLRAKLARAERDLGGWISEAERAEAHEIELGRFWAEDREKLQAAEARAEKAEAALKIAEGEVELYKAQASVATGSVAEVREALGIGPNTYCPDHIRELIAERDSSIPSLRMPDPTGQAMLEILTKKDARRCKKCGKTEAETVGVDCRAVLVEGTHPTCHEF